MEITKLTTYRGLTRRLGLFRIRDNAARLMRERREGKVRP